MKKYIKLILIAAVLLVGIQTFAQKVLAAYDFSFFSREVDLSSLGISSFSFPSLYIPKIVTIDNTANTITVTVPAGTNITYLTPKITTDYSRAVVTPTGPQNFTNPVTYTVDSDGNIKTYIVSVSVQRSSEKKILLFTFPQQVSATSTVIDEINKTISVTLPYGTDITKLTPTITVSPGATVNFSGTPINFINGWNYTVTAEDGSAVYYRVAVKALPQYNYILGSDVAVDWNTANRICRDLGGSLPSGAKIPPIESIWAFKATTPLDKYGTIFKKYWTDLVYYDSVPYRVGQARALKYNNRLDPVSFEFVDVDTGGNVLYAGCAIPTGPVNGACGPNATSTYSVDSGRYTSAFCSSGITTPVIPAFPAVGSSVTWSCNGMKGGISASCTATRAAAVATSTTATTTYTLSVNASSPGGNVIQSPNKASYPAGESVVMTATPRTGYIFKNWSGGITGTVNSQTVVITPIEVTPTPVTPVPATSTPTTPVITPTIANMSGDWNRTFVYAGKNYTSRASFTQTGTSYSGTDVATNGSTGVSDGGVISGSINGTSIRETRVKGTSKDTLTATLSSDGNSYTGTWSNSSGASGSFRGTRVSPITMNSSGYATASLGWDGFIKLLQILR